MKYTIEIHENDNPDGVKFWATVSELECNLEEETIEEMIKNAPSIIKDIVELSNQKGATFGVPTEFEFRVLIHA